VTVAMEGHSYTARCFCGEVELKVGGTPLFVGYCHCQSCRTWLGAPVHAVTLWQTQDVEVTKGASLLKTFIKMPRSHRQHCTNCGGAVMNAHPLEGEDMIDVMASLLIAFPFEPTMHVHYQERIIDMRDGLPKYAELPEEWGGNGQLLAE